MGKLRLASTDTTRLPIGDEDYLEVHTDISKGMFNRLMLAMPDRQFTEGEDVNVTPEESIMFSRALFDALVVGWSLPEEANPDNYERLENEASQLVDAALVEHFGKISPTKEQQSKVTTSRGSRRKANG